MRRSRRDQVDISKSYLTHSRSQLVPSFPVEAPRLPIEVPFFRYSEASAPPAQEGILRFKLKGRKVRY